MRALVERAGIGRLIMTLRRGPCSCAPARCCFNCPRQAARADRRRQLSPVELMDACIARIEALNPAVNAIAATDFERACRARRPSAR
jgi:hypothetical protein